MTDHLDLQRFCHQALQLEQHLDFPNGTLLRQHGCQHVIFRQLFSEQVPYHLPARYRIRVLKELLSAIETSIEDWDEHGVSDELMSSLSNLLASPLPSEAVSAQQKCYVTYHLSLLSQSSPPSITLLESRSIISASGTTGLRTWEAALHLGQYMCLNRSLVEGKRVLELGAGTGYLAILCAKHLGAAQVIASDGSDDVVNFLPENFFLNGLEGSNVLSAMDLKWGHAVVGTEEKDWNSGNPIDIVVGADVTYDESIPALVSTLQELFVLFPSLEVLISATERNKETYDSFIQNCQLRRLGVSRLEFRAPATAAGSCPFYSQAVPIHICRIFKEAD